MKNQWGYETLRRGKEGWNISDKKIKKKKIRRNNPIPWVEAGFSDQSEKGRRPGSPQPKQDANASEDPISRPKWCSGPRSKQTPSIP